MYPRSMADSDCVIVMGSNMAENHPVAFRWPMQAKVNGAKLIHVDPRFTRTSALADAHLPLRPGSDIAFLGGLIHHVLEHGHEFRDYVVAYTNASHIIEEGVALPEDLARAHDIRWLPLKVILNDQAFVAATSAGQNGHSWDTVRIAVAYAPMPKNAACPSEICPAMPVIVFRPRVSTA